MLLSCPECKTRYLLPAHTLAPGGRRVKCTNCGAIWHQEPDLDELREDSGDDLEDIPDSVKPIPEGSGMPRIQDMPPPQAENPRARLGGYIAAGVVFVLVFAVLMLAHGPVVRAWPPSTMLYRPLGLEAAPGEGLVFDRMKASAEKRPQGEGENFVLEGQVINLTRKTQVVPMIEVSLRTESGQNLEHWLIAPPEKTVAAEGTLPFRAEYRATQDGAKNIFVRFVLVDHAEDIDAPAKTGAEAGDNNPAPAPAD